MARGIIYLILNKQTGHKFIGNTTLAMNKEWVHHIDKSKRMSAEPLHKAFRQYGVHNFMIKELDECEESEFENKTNYWIDKYNPEYNPVREIKIKEKEVEEEEPKPYVKKKGGKGNPQNLQPFNENTRSTGKHSGLRIRGKNLETGEVSVWNTVREAAEAVTGDPKKNSNIIRAAREGFKCYGYKWFITEPDKKKKKPVFGVGKKTGMIELRYESVTAALQDLSHNNCSAGLYKSLKNPGRFSWNGRYWFYG